MGERKVKEEQMTNVVWEDPPSDRRQYKRNRYVEGLRELCLSPETWGKIDTFTNAQTANSARNNLKYAVQLKRYRMPEEASGFTFEITVRKVGSGEWGLWARALPKEDDWCTCSEVHTCEGHRA